LLEVPKTWANTIRQVFNTPLGINLGAPTRVALQSLGNTGWVIHNYNKAAVDLNLAAEGTDIDRLTNGFSEEKISAKGSKILNLKMKPRSRIWLKKMN
jgi:hypothetical protein